MMIMLAGLGTANDARCCHRATSPARTSPTRTSPARSCQRRR